MSDIEAYLNNATSSQKAEFERIRKIVKEVAPSAEESISYGVPCFKHKGRPLVYFGAFKNHMSIYPASDDLVDAVGGDLAKFRTSKGTLQFTEVNPIPESVIKEIIEFRLNSISDK